MDNKEVWEAQIGTLNKRRIELEEELEAEKRHSASLRDDVMLLIGEVNMLKCPFHQGDEEADCTCGGG